MSVGHSLLPAPTIAARIIFATMVLCATTCSSLQEADDNNCDCYSFVTENRGENWVYPLAWMPYIQEKIFFSIDADHNAMISLSKHTYPLEPRYLVVLQEDNTNKAAIKRCLHNATYTCIDESVVESPSPYLVNGTRQYYWMKVKTDDYSMEIGRLGAQQPFVSFTPGFGLEIGIHWIGLSGVKAGVRWQFCDMVLKSIAQQNPSVQSSTLVESGIAYNASRANNFETILQLPGYCSQTAYFDIEPWWRVDLEAVYNVKMVRLWNDIDDRPHQLEGVTIYVGSKIFSTNQQIREQAKHCGAGSVTKYEAETDNIVTRTCDYNTGQYVYLVKRAPILKICGVEVFGYRENMETQDTNTKSCMEKTSNSPSVALICISCSILIVIIVGAAYLSYAYIYPTSSCGLNLLKIRNSFRKDTIVTTHTSTGKYSLVTL